MTLQEATRPITVREGDRGEEVPAIQAVMRSMLRFAAQGDARSQRQLFELITRAEADRALAAKDDAASMLEYQAWAEKQIADHQQKGLDPPELFPHPDDIIYDFVTSEVTIDGPVTEEQAGAEKVLRERFDSKLRRYHEIEQELKNDPSNKKLKAELAEHQRYVEYSKIQLNRAMRHQSLKLMRDAMQPKLKKQKKRPSPTRNVKSEEGGKS